MWQPTTKQLELVVTMAHARAPAAAIAAAVGLAEDEFRSWCATLAAARELMMALAVMPLPPRRLGLVADSTAPGWPIGCSRARLRLIRRAQLLCAPSH